MKFFNRYELEKAKKMLEDTLNYRRTLTYMTTRLKEERLTYDNTLKAYEEALEVRRAEGAEVRALAAEVRMAKTQEERELVRFYFFLFFFIFFLFFIFRKEYFVFYIYFLIFSNNILLFFFGSTLFFF